MSTRLKSEPIERLSASLRNPSVGLRTILDAGPAVRARFHPIFARAHLPKLTQDEFRSFLLYKNNQHWVGLHRGGPTVCADMKRLRRSLAVLLDESKPIDERLDRLAPGGRDAVPKLGRAIMTAILMVVHPSKYGVWNARSESTMKALGLWPELRGAKSFGARYRRVNEVILAVAKRIPADLWALDGLWWSVTEGASPVEREEDGVVAATDDPDTSEHNFGLERHLHNFLYDNWKRTSLGKDWELHTHEGDDVGYEYETPIGRIDLLARHRREKRWLVVELKRGQTSDQTVGQVLRYIGFVEKNLAKKGEKVEGIIIAQSGDEQLKYALGAIDRVRLLCYRVDFRLESGA